MDWKMSVATPMATEAMTMHSSVGSRQPMNILNSFGLWMGLLISRKAAQAISTAASSTTRRMALRR